MGKAEPWTMGRSAALAILLLVLVLGTAPPTVRAAGPTLTIVAPAEGAVIGNGTPVSVVFVTSGFNLTEPGMGGGNSTEGHVEVFVDDALVTLASRPTVDLPLPSGTHGIRLRLVSDNGTGLTPEVSASVAVTVTQGPAVGTPRIEITYVEIAYPDPGVVLDDDVTISFRVTDFALVPPGRGTRVPNEGHVVVVLDGTIYRTLTSYGQIPFSDLPDGLHTVTLRLADDAGQSLTPDVSDTVTFRTQREAVVDINPYLSIAQIVLGLAILGVLFYRGPGLDRLERIVRRVRGRIP